MDDLISRQAAIDAINCDITITGRQNAELVAATIGSFADRIKALPSAQPDIIRCKDCKWWDRYNDYKGYCMAAKSCTYTTHWDIQIRRTYDGDFYCAHAEPKEEYEEGEDE